MASVNRALLVSSCRSGQHPSVSLPIRQTAPPWCRRLDHRLDRRKHDEADPSDGFPTGYRAQGWRFEIAPRNAAFGTPTTYVFAGAGYAASCRLDVHLLSFGQPGGPELIRELVGQGELVHITNLSVLRSVVPSSATRSFDFRKSHTARVHAADRARQKSPAIGLNQQCRGAVIEGA
jgi:hypothetical protein